MTAVNYVEENSTRDVTQTEKKCSHEVAETPSLSGQIVKNLNFSSCLCELCGCFLKTRKVSELRFLSEAGSRRVNLKKTKPGNQGSFLGCSESFCKGGQDATCSHFWQVFNQRGEATRSETKEKGSRTRPAAGCLFPTRACSALPSQKKSRHVASG